MFSSSHPFIGGFYSTYEFMRTIENDGLSTVVSGVWWYILCVAMLF
jgi:hypothetical protein